MGWWAVLVPVVGGLVIGLMARYGSDRIRGHGIPEAMEAILIGKSRMQPKVAVLEASIVSDSIRSRRAFETEEPITSPTKRLQLSIIAVIWPRRGETLLVAAAAGQRRSAHPCRVLASNYFYSS